MARRRGRFRRRSSSPLPTGSFRSRMPSLKAFRENFCPRFIGCTRPRTIEPQTKRADRGRRRLLPVQKNIFRETLTTIRKSCLWFPTRAIPNFRRSNQSDRLLFGDLEFFSSLSFFPSLFLQFFRLQPSRAPLEDIEDNQETHNSADKARQTKSAKRFFSLSSNKAIPFSRISLSLSIYTYI